MIETATLSLINPELALSGRNKPIRATVLDSANKTHDVYLKPAGWGELTIHSAMREYAAVCLARLLDLPFCRPFWVECPDSLKPSRPGGGNRSLGDCVWPAFGSTAAGPQWGSWVATQPIHPDAIGMALTIFAFDAFIHNPDRIGDNPNLLVKTADFRIIDHEFAFRSLDPSVEIIPPWQVGALDWIAVDYLDHVLLDRLRRHQNLDFAPVLASWSGLSDADLASIASGLPQSHANARDELNDILRRVRDVRSNIAGAVIELERILA